MKLINIIVKPTKYNKNLLKKRGLFSNDSSTFFNMYETIMNNEIFEILEIQNPYFTKELLDAKIKF